MGSDMTISRVTRSKQEAQKTYDRLSRWYEWIAGNSEITFVEAGLAMLDVQPGQVVLEIGFGTGHGIVALVKAVGAGGRVRGIDLSQGMLDCALARVKTMGVEERIELRQGDAMNLPYAAHQFDAIFMSMFADYADRGRAFGAEVRRLAQTARAGSGGRTRG